MAKKLVFGSKSIIIGVLSIIIIGIVYSLLNHKPLDKNFSSNLNCEKISSVTNKIKLEFPKFHYKNYTIEKDAESRSFSFNYRKSLEEPILTYQGVYSETINTSEKSGNEINNIIDEKNVNNLETWINNNLDSEFLKLGFTKEIEYTQIKQTSDRLIDKIYSLGDTIIQVRRNVPDQTQDLDYFKSNYYVNFNCGKKDNSLEEAYKKISNLYSKDSEISIWENIDNLLIVNHFEGNAIAGSTTYYDTSSNKIEKIFEGQNIIDCLTLRQRNIGKGSNYCSEL